MVFKGAKAEWFVFPLLVLLLLVGLYLKFIDFPSAMSAGNFATGYLAAGNFSMGVFAAGTFAIGIFSVGIFSIGIFSIGIFSVGVWSFAIFAYGAYAKNLEYQKSRRR